MPNVAQECSRYRDKTRARVLMNGTLRKYCRQEAGVRISRLRTKNEYENLRSYALRNLYLLDQKNRKKIEKLISQS